MYQKFVAVGNLGKDPDVRYTASGVPVANFSVAVTERFKDKAGEWKENTEWLNCVAWQGLADYASKALAKGSTVLLEGKLQTRSWEDKQSGEKKYKTEINVLALRALDKKNQRDEYNQETNDDIPF